MRAEIDMAPTGRVLAQVRRERQRQDEKWGPQRSHPDGTGGAALEAVAKLRKLATDAAAASGRLTWMDVLAEEVAEAFAESDPTRLRDELVQVAAVAVAWVEAIDCRG